MATKLSTLLEEVPAMRLLAIPLKRIQELHHVYSDAVPNALSKISQVGYLDGDTLVLIAFNGTAATQLRQRLPSLLSIIQRLQPQITAIQIEVQVEKLYTPLVVEARNQNRRVLSGGARSLEQLANSLPDSPLRKALKQLAGRAISSNQQQSFDDEKEGNCSEKDNKKPE